MEGSKGPGPDASRKDSGDCGPVGEAIPVRTEEGAAGNGAPPRSGPLTPTPPSRGSSPESSGSETRRRRRPRRPKRRLSSDSSNGGDVTPTSQTPLKMTKVGEGGMSEEPSSSPVGSDGESLISVVTVSPSHDAACDEGSSLLPLVNGPKKPDNRPKDDRPPKTTPSASVPPKVGKKNQKAPPSNQPNKPAANQRFTAEGASRRRLFQQGTRTPAFVEYPVVLHDLGGGAARFDKLGPWHRSQLLANAVGAIRSVRPLPSGKWLIGCSSEAQQSKLARLETLPGGVPIGARVPRPVVDGVVGPIPKGGNELQLVRQDLEAGGHRVAAVTRLNNKYNEPSLAVRISLEATELPTEVWLGSTPYNVQAYAAPVRRCTKCQSLGHTKQQCRARQGRCSKCGKNSHTHDKCDAATMSCVNCNGRHSAAYKGCPEMLIRQRANTLRSRTYLPYTVAMQRAREELKPRVLESEQPAAKPVDDCWSRDRVETTVPLTVGAGPPRTYAGVAAGRTARAGGGAGGGGPGFATRASARKGQQQQSVGQRSTAGRKGGAAGGSESGPGAARATTKGVTSKAVTELLSRISEVSSVWGDGPVSPLAEEPTVSAAPPTSTKSRGATSGTEAEAPSKQQPKSSTRRTRRKKGSRAVMEKTALQYQLLLEQQKNRRLLEELSNSAQKIDLGTELDQLYTKSKVDLQEKLDETLSLDGFLWKLMLSLLETRQSGDCAPLLNILTAVFNKITGQKRQTPSMSRPLDLMLVLAGVLEAPAGDKLSPVIC